MNAQDLKNSILQLALQGKLVEQRVEEGTAKELLEQIKAEKEQLIKEKKIKKEQPLPKISEDEIPFDIPESWEWVRLGSLLHKLTDGAHSTPKYTDSGIPFLSVKDISGGKINFSNTKYISKEEHDSLYKRCNPEQGDILLTKVGTTGIPVIVETDQEFSLFVSVALLKFGVNLINNKFLVYAIKSPVVQVQCDKNTRGVGNKNWVMRDIASTILPLPPLEEQKRIVAKIEGIMPYVEKYGEAHSKLEVFNKKFPDDMQKSILQYAIQGKLVEQRDEEGTAEALYQHIQEEKDKLIKEGKIKKGKPLPAITEDEIPFDIPESWKWVRLGDISLNIGDIDHKMPPTVEEGYPYVSPLNFTTNSIDYDGAKKIGQKDFEHLSKKFKPERNDIIFPRYGTIGVIRMVDTDREFLVSYSCCTIKNIEKYVYPKYVFYILKSGMTKKEINRYINKTTQPNIGLESIKKFMIPIPPLEEQKRIVVKIEEMMPYCQQLV